ncbi:unnamed protein product [Didymodactylos carnosus]|uniref:Uncharacterized protein n=1 Tax=Didymodactylos carnosus TaxID=1234261 RepID=A0A8S2FXU0_9BILA|nr:unnamed protein product [Didymodactylos carnosus]CAF4386633.1 unnamed protein product [Didymodactylos carnosus]
MGAKRDFRNDLVETSITNKTSQCITCIIVYSGAYGGVGKEQDETIVEAIDDNERKLIVHKKTYMYGEKEVTKTIIQITVRLETPTWQHLTT